MGKKKVTDLKIAQSGRTLVATWKFNTSTYKKLDHYDISWQFLNPLVNRWTDPETSKPVTGYSEKTVPDNCTHAKVTVIPVQNKNRGKAKKWTGDKVTATKNVGIAVPIPPNPTTPEVTIRDGKMDVVVDSYSVTTIDESYVDIVFYVMELSSGGGSTVWNKTYSARVKYARAQYTQIKVSPGKSYRVRARAYNRRDKVYSEEYSDWSEVLPTAPGDIKTFTVQAVAVDPDENILRVELKWSAASNVSDEENDGYEIEYTKNVSYFDRSSDDVYQETKEYNSLQPTSMYIAISEGGTYYFRIRGFNSNGKGAWSNNVEVSVGMKPDAPTTWTYATSVAIGDNIIFNWTHNSADGSKQEEAEITVTIVEAENQETEPVPSTIHIDGDANRYEYSTTGLTDGTKVLWTVATKGVYYQYSDPSVQRTVYIYEEPSVDLQLDLTPVNNDIPSDAEVMMTSYPLKVTLAAAPPSQKAITFDFRIIANSAYITEDDTGLSHYVAPGDVIYSTTIDNPEGNTVSFELDPGNVVLETDADFTASVTVGMDSGLSASSEVEFYVLFGDDPFDPDAEVFFNVDEYTALIRPFCADEFGAEMRSGATMRVYRANYDGTFTLIENGEDGYIPVGQSISLLDPHPTLDYARYRIVARSDSTGQIAYTDVATEALNIKSAIFNWEDERNRFGNEEVIIGEDEVGEDVDVVVGSTLVLPYNIDVSESNMLDVELVEYIGRENPVSYYGTQKGYSASWKCEIPKGDTTTLSAIRRLARYAGDVYVREGSGSGYWAFVKVSYNVDHKKLTVPVTFDITRVEGGM